MKHFLTLFITALLATTASGAANVGVGSMPTLTSFSNNQYVVVSTGNTSNSPVRLVPFSAISNKWNSAFASGGGGISGTFPVVIQNNTNVTLAVPPTNRPMVMSSVANQMTNAFKRYYFDTNVAPSLSNLVAAAASGDVVELGAGTFNIGNQTIRIPVGVTLKGQGMYRTIINGTVFAGTNSIVQMMSSNVLEDFSIRAGNRSGDFQYPLANLSQKGHAPATNVLIRRISVDGESDVFQINQTNYTSGTIEDSVFETKWDGLMFEVSDIAADGIVEYQLGGNWRVYRTKVISNPSGATLAAATNSFVANAITVGGVHLEVVDSYIVATNGKASAALYMTGQKTNLVRIFGGQWEAAGTNSAYIINDLDGIDSAFSRVEVYGAPAIRTANSTAAGQLVFGAFDAASLRSHDDLFVTDGLFARTASITNALEAGSITTETLDATGTSTLADVAASSLVMSGATGSRVAMFDVNGAVTNVTSSSPSTEYVKADGTTGVPSGGGGGTNFPAVVLLAGATNMPIVAGIEALFHQDTNAAFTANISQSGAFVSGQIVGLSVSNASGSDFDVTIRTNSVLANPYYLGTKTNVNTFTASASAITKAWLRYTAAGRWELERIEGPAAIQKFGPGIIPDTNGVNGLDITVSTKRLTNYAHATTQTINGTTDVDMTVTNDLSAGVTLTVVNPTPGTSGRFRFRADGSGETVAFQCWPAALVPLATNNLVNTTNISAAASKWMHCNYDIARGTNGTTNLFLWVIKEP